MVSRTNYSLVEGDYKNFRFRRIEPKDYDAVCEHIAEHFVRQEPTSQLLGYSDKFAEEFNAIVRLILPHGMSFLAEDKDTGEIAGVRVTFHHTKDVFDGLQVTTRQVKLLLKIIEEIESSARVQDRCGVDSWAEFLVASTNSKYGRTGLAGEFYTRSLAFLKAEGFKHALVIVTHAGTKAATTRRGFEELSRLDYDKFLDFDGKPAFNKSELTPDHFAVCKIKKIE